MTKKNLNKVSLLPFTATKEVKLALFQYKIIQNVLADKQYILENSSKKAHALIG